MNKELLRHVMIEATPGAIDKWMKQVRSDKTFDRCPRCFIENENRNETGSRDGPAMIRFAMASNGAYFSNHAPHPDFVNDAPWLEAKLDLSMSIALICSDCGFRVTVPDDIRWLVVDMLKAKGPHAISRALQQGLMTLSGATLQVAKAINSLAVETAKGNIASVCVASGKRSTAMGILNL